MNLHLGCGDRIIEYPEWENVDLYAHLDGVVGIDVRELSAVYGADAADLIYASHLLQYFDEREAVDVLRDWRYVLKPGGTLRLAVPDFEALLHVYAETGGSLASIIGPLFGRWETCSKVEPVIYHKTVYDFPTLAYVLRVAGYRAVRKWNWRNTRHNQIDDGSQAYFPHMDKQNGLLLSLNVEATK